jgi:hypothetical protein
LPAEENPVHWTAMKFALAILTFLVMAAILGGGVLALIAGKPLLFIVGVVGFILAFAKFGCLSH